MSKKKIFKIFGLLLVVGLLFAAPTGQAQAQGTTHYVNLDGLCGGQTPCYTSIQAAINAASAGDTINIAAGTYSESLGGYRDFELFKSLNLIGAGATQTIVQLTGLQHGIEIRPDTLGTVKLEGIHFTNLPTNTYSAGWPIVIGETGGTFNSIILKDVRVEKAEARNVHFVAGATYNSILMEYCNIHESGAWGASIAGTTHSLTVKDSVFWGNGALQPAYGYGLDLSGSSTNITNVLITGGQFNYNWKSGLLMAGVSDVTVRGIEANGNGESGISITEWQSKSQNILIDNVTASNNTHDGINIAPDGPDKIENVDIIGSTLTNNKRNGVNLVYINAGANNTSMSDITMRRNVITGNTNKAIEVYAWWVPMTITDVFDARANWFGAATGPAAGSITTDNLDYMPWCYTADCTELYVPAGGTIQSAIDVAEDGNIIHVAAGMYYLDAIQEINKNLTIIGEDKTTTFVKPSVSLSYLFRVNSGYSLNLSNFTLDGEGFNSYGAIKINDGATGTITNNIINNFVAPGYTGFGIVDYGSNVTISNNVLSNIGRVGIWVGGADNTISNNTYTGKGAGDWLDYGVEVGYGGTATISGNTITNCLGVASSDGSTSGGIMVTDYYGDGSTATITGNTLSGNTTGVLVGYDDTDASNATISDNTFANNEYQVGTTSHLIALDLDATFTGNTFDKSVMIVDGLDIFTSIQDAVDDAVDTDTILVGPGIYPEAVNVNKSVTITGTGEIETFTDLITIGDTQAPETWYKDRYAPGVFENSTFLGEPVLLHGIRAVDLQTDPFRNTQGRKYDIDLTGPTQLISIDMFVAEDWGTETRYSGLWATGFDNTEAISAYPILAWRNNEGDGPGFFAYDYSTGAWLPLRDAVPEDYGKWHTFEIELTVGTGVNYFVDGEFLLTFADTDTVSLGNAILNVKNFGEDYDVYWDNFAAHDTKVIGQMDIDASNVAIKGLILSNPGAQYGMQINALADTVDITENLFVDIGSEALTQDVKGIYLVHGSDNVTIENNLFERIHANEKSVNAIFSGDSNTTDPAEGLVIQDNRFLNITSQTKGGYGVELNNLAGNPGAIIDGNRFSGISGGWTHAIGLEGPTAGAEVTDNTFYNLTALSADNLAVLFEANPVGDTVEVSGNRFQNVGYGVGIHYNDLNAYGYTVDATLNYWGSACGPSAGLADVGPNVLYSPWYTDVELAATGEGTLGSFVFPTGSTTDSMNAIIACAAPGSTLTFEGGTYPGGLFVGPDKYDLTFELNGVTVGAGSPAFTISGDDITVNGPGIIDGDAAEEGDTSPGIAVFGDNFILDGVELRNWNGGAVVVPEPVESLKIVNNWFHYNGAGLQVQDTPTGVITIEGNLFKVNGIGVDYDGAGYLDATYNSWGDIDGPGNQAGTYVLANPFNYYELYFDMDPATTDEDIERRVAVSQTFDVVLKADAVDVYGLSFKFTYDPTKLVLNTTTFDSVWDGKCQLVGIPPVGTVEYRCNLLEPDLEWQGGAIATFNYTVIASSPESFFDIYTTDPLELNPLNPTAGAVGGVKVWVNNGGYNEASATTRLLTDINDGKLIIDAIANFTGFIDLEGRPNDSGALVQVFDAATSGVLKATATSESSGKYTTVYEPGMWMVVSTVDPAYTVTYYIEIDRALFLPIQQKAEELTQSPLTSLPTLLLLGGDGNDDDVIDIGDASCIGNAYGTSSNMCSGGAGANSDVNEDGIVNIYDLTLMGGNFTKTFSPWY